MRRTRKWAYIEQEAKRLAALGLSGYAIAKRLDVNESSVSRWVKAGKLTLKGAKTGKARTRRGVIAGSVVKTPAGWAASVRDTYSLDATDDQLVTGAESALALSRDPNADPRLRLQAMARFQAIVRQLALVARQEPQQAPVEPPKRKVHPPVVRRSGIDPRAFLTAVK